MNWPWHMNAWKEVLISKLFVQRILGIVPHTLNHADKTHPTSVCETFWESWGHLDQSDVRSCQPGLYSLFMTEMNNELLHAQSCTQTHRLWAGSEARCPPEVSPGSGMQDKGVSTVRSAVAIVGKCLLLLLSRQGMQAIWQQQYAEVSKATDASWREKGRKNPNFASAFLLGRLFPTRTKAKRESELGFILFMHMYFRRKCNIKYTIKLV